MTDQLYIVQATAPDGRRAEFATISATADEAIATAKHDPANAGRQDWTYIAYMYHSRLIFLPPGNED